MPQTTIAYPFIHSKLKDKELELSILSMLKFFQGDLDILIVGDKPAFNLPSWARVVEVDNHREALKDAIAKIEIINRHVRSDDWIFCHDDMFALEDFKVEDLQDTVLYTHLRDLSKDWPQADNQKWAGVKRDTGFMLGASDMFDTATHFPRVFNRIEVEATLGFGDRMCDGKLWDFQIVYDHLFSAEKRKMIRTLDYGKFFRFEHPMDEDSLRLNLANMKFMNTGSEAFNDAVIKVVSDRFGDGSVSEIDTSPPKSRSVYEKCKHRGDDTGETGKCGTCSTLTKEIPIFYCGVHKFATVRPLKHSNPVYQRPMNCIQCWADNLGFEKNPSNENDPKHLPVQPTSTVD